jgi:hypothetical protein
MIGLLGLSIVFYLFVDKPTLILYFEILIFTLLDCAAKLLQQMAQLKKNIEDKRSQQIF